MKTFNIQYIIDEYNNGQSATSIAKELNTSHTTILKRLVDNNVNIRPKYSYIAGTRVYNLNERYFKNINTTNKAYILGLIYADGNISLYSRNRKHMTLVLHKQDEHILDSIKSELNYNGPFHYVDNKIYFKICSNIFCKDLIEHGVYPNKSLILKYPENLKEEYNSHFIRGYFDGDGCIDIRNRVNFLGTYDFLTKLKNIIVSNTTCSNNVSILKRNKIYSLTWTRTSDINELFNYMYYNSKLHIQRKYEKFKKQN